MGIEIGARYQIGSDKYIEPIAIEMEYASGNKVYACRVHRADGRITTAGYYTGHIIQLIQRYERVQQANKD